MSRYKITWQRGISSGHHFIEAKDWFEASELSEGEAEDKGARVIGIELVEEVEA